MSAPKNNRFWKKRSKHGRDKIFATPEILMEAANEYFDFCEKNPFIEIDFKGKDAKEVEIPKMRPFTIRGLCIFLGVNKDYFTDFRDGLKGKEDKESKDFSRIIAHIYDIAYDQKFSGAASGFLNPNIIARDLGLVDNKDIKTGGEKINQPAPVIQVFNETPPLASSEDEIED